MAELSLADKIVALDRALTAAGVEHAFGGALALAYYAEPRATADIDVNVFAPPSHARELVDALAELDGFEPTVDPVAVERDGQARLAWGRTPVDLFFAYDDIHEQMARNRASVPFGNVTIPVLSAVDLVVCKAIFDRAKDWVDIESMIDAGTSIDADTCLASVERIVGPGDGRLAKLAKVLRSG
jgi:hypothetical protein